MTAIPTSKKMMSVVRTPISGKFPVSEIFKKELLFESENTIL